MNKRPTVSIVIPCFNEQDYIIDALNSVFTQSFSDYEIVIVDNNSADKTAEIIKNLDDKRVRLVREKEQGLVYARNLGIREARGEWILRMDADARLHENWLEHALIMLESENAVAASSLIEPFESDVSRWGVGTFNFMTYQVNRLLIGSNMLFGSAMIFHTSLKSKILNQARMRNDIWEDLDIALVLRKKKKILIKDTPVYISLRRFYSPLVESIKYVWMWTKTYWFYNKLASLILALTLIVASPLIIITTYIGLAYVPKIKSD